MKETILGIVRHAMTFGGGFLVSAGLVMQDDLTTAVSAFVGLVGFAWSIYEKWRAKKQAVAG